MKIAKELAFVKLAPDDLRMGPHLFKHEGSFPFSLIARHMRKAAKQRGIAIGAQQMNSLLHSVG